MRKYSRFFLVFMAVCMVIMVLIPPKSASAETAVKDEYYEFTSEDSITIKDDRFNTSSVEQLYGKFDKVTKVTVDTARIDFDVFEYFPNIETVTLSKETTKISLNSYYDLEYPTLKEIIVAKENPDYQSEECVLYTKGLGKLLFYPAAAKKDVVVPKETRIIGYKAFMNVPITSITIAEGLTIIEEKAFQNTKLQEISLPKSLVAIEPDAFIQSPLSKITIASGNKTLCFVDGVVYTKDQKQLYCWPEAKVAENLKLPESLVYLDCSKIPTFAKTKTITIPQNLTAIVHTECNQLHTINLSKKNPYFSMYDGVMYSSNGKQIRLYPNQNPDTQIRINPKVESLPLELFYEENTTITLILPKNLKALSGQMWRDKVLLGGFTHLKKLKFAGKNANFTLKDGVLYNKKMTSILWYPIDLESKTYVMPSTITAVHNDQLVKQNHLEKVTISKNCVLLDYSRINDIYEQFYEMPFGSECTSLKQFAVARNSKNYTVKDGVLFSKNGGQLLGYPCAKQDKTYEIPSGVSIAPFGNQNPYLTTLIVPSSVVILGAKSAVESDSGWNGFVDYTALKEIKVNEENPYFSSIDGVVYRKNGERLELMIYPLGKQDEILTLPEKAWAIAAIEYLKDHPNLKQIKIHRSVENLNYQPIRLENGILQFEYYDIWYRVPNIQVIMIGKENEG